MIPYRSIHTYDPNAPTPAMPSPDPRVVKQGMADLDADLNEMEEADQDFRL